MLIYYDHTVHMSDCEGFGTLLMATDTSNALLDPVLYGAYVHSVILCERAAELLRPPYERDRAQLEYKLTVCGGLHWAGLQAPGGTLAAIYITLRRYFTTPHPTHD
jgi:hypothetical protein